ncbi:MAG: hypothetical protein Q9187_003794 [Circinaria calcarea]
MALIEPCRSLFTFKYLELAHGRFTRGRNEAQVVPVKAAAEGTLGHLLPRWKPLDEPPLDAIWEFERTLDFYCYRWLTSWIGVPDDEEETYLAVQLMRKFNIVLRDGLAANNDDIHAASAGISDDNQEIFPKPGTDCYRGWLGISKMFNQSYWRRAWVYQEATGPAPTRYYCGNHWFNMIYLCAAVFMAHHFAEFTDLDSRFQKIARGPVFLLQAFRRDGTFSYGSSLLSLLESTRSTESTDPRDKVYAPLGLATDLSPASISPDYAKSLEAVYGDVVRFSLSQPDHGLQVLGHVIRPAANSKHIKSAHNGPELPSWIPDFRENLGLNPFCTNVSYSSATYNACGPHKTHNAKIEGSRLILDGIRIDQISTLSAIWEENAFSTAEVRSWAPETPNTRYAPTGQTLDEAFRTTVLADMNPLTQSRGHMVDWELLESRNDTLNPSLSARKNQMNVALKSASGCRRLCWTTRGRMGIVPAATSLGDLVCMLFGGQVLYVLRSTGQDHYEFMGECYIHGSMDGEAFEQGAAQAIDRETFSLV